MKNRYGITYKSGGWWLVLDEPCKTHIIGKAAQTKHVAVIQSLELLIAELQQEIDEVKSRPDNADELIKALYVHVIPSNCIEE